jgi:hypothetical protein
MIELELARESDCISIFDKLLQLQAKSPAPQMALCEPDVAYRHLKQAVREGRLYLFGDYAILVDIGSPWHTTRRVLIEEIILRFRSVNKNSVESAIEQLSIIAKVRGCAAVAAGDTQIGLMSPRYIAAGFQPLGTQFYKGIS